MLSCLDCINCKIDLKHTVLRCSKYRWLDGNGKVKYVSLSKTDISSAGLHIKHRVIFETAEMCEKTGDCESMEE
jgi:hypothetical protein